MMKFETRGQKNNDEFAAEKSTADAAIETAEFPPDEAREQSGKDFQLREEQALENSSGKLKKAFLAVTAGLLVWGAASGYAFAETSVKDRISERQALEQSIKEQQEKLGKLQQEEFKQQREERRLNWERELQNYFQLKGLSLGKAKTGYRGQVESYGIYLNGEYLDDVHSIPDRRFTRENLINRTAEVLRKKGVAFEEKKEVTDFAIEISPDAASILKKWGGKIDGRNFMIGTEGLHFDEKTKSVNIIKATDAMLIVVVTDFDGTISMAPYVNGEEKTNTIIPPGKAKKK